MDNITTDTETFNKEIIWDSKKKLFEIHFKKEILDNKYRLANLTYDDLEFNKAIEYLAYL